MGITITLRQAKELVEVFGGNDAEVNVEYLSEPYTDDEGELHEVGLYASLADYPEEGVIYLGPTEVEE